MTRDKAITLALGSTVIALIAWLPFERSGGHEDGRAEGIAAAQDGACAVAASRTVAEQLEDISNSIVVEQ